MFDLFDHSKIQDIPDEKTADFINEYFVNTGPKIAQQYDTEWNFNGDKAEISLDDK